MGLASVSTLARPTSRILRAPPKNIPIHETWVIPARTAEELEKLQIVFRWLRSANSERLKKFPSKRQPPLKIRGSQG